MLYIIFILIGVVSIFQAAFLLVRFVRDEIRCVRYRQRFYRQFED